MLPVYPPVLCSFPPFISTHTPFFPSCCQALVLLDAMRVPLPILCVSFDRANTHYTANIYIIGLLKVFILLHAHNRVVFLPQCPANKEQNKKKKKKETNVLVK